MESKWSSEQESLIPSKKSEGNLDNSKKVIEMA